MTEQKTKQKFDSNFHKWYVDGEGEVEEGVFFSATDSEMRPETLESVLETYRRYIGDPEAELPQEIIDQLTLGAAS